MMQRIIWLYGTLLVLLWPVIALAARRQEDEREVVDARLEGYDRNVTLDDSAAFTWFILVILGIICFAALFKNARRTHLD